MLFLIENNSTKGIYILLCKPYISKTIPYSLETLTIEFNRDIDQIRVAFDILIELEMLEFTEDKIYRVKNFAKHQNIKVKKKDKVLNIENSTKNNETEIKENLKDEIKAERDIRAEETKGEILNEIKTTRNYEIEEKKRKI